MPEQWWLLAAIPSFCRTKFQINFIHNAMEVTIHHTENLPELVSMLLVCSSVDTKDLCSMIEYVDKMNKVATAIQGHIGMLE